MFPFRQVLVRYFIQLLESKPPLTITTVIVYSRPLKRQYFLLVANCQWDICLVWIRLLNVLIKVAVRGQDQQDFKLGFSLQLSKVRKGEGPERLRNTG
jgi:hypothetical protein